MKISPGGCHRLVEVFSKKVWMQLRQGEIDRYSELKFIAEELLNQIIE